MTEFKKGDMVRVTNVSVGRYRQAGVISEIKPSAYLQIVVEFRDDKKGGYHQDELELVEPESLVGKLVKITRTSTWEGRVDRETCDYIHLEGAAGFSKNPSGGVVQTVEVLPDPIVLPTKKNALIAVGRAKSIMRLSLYGDWFNTFGHIVKNEDILANAAREGYRVIFEGEDC
jgi:hypothetical protein